MAKFKKVVSAPGTYQTPDGLAVVTPERIRHWHDTARAILAAGHKIPLSWGHVSKATPHTEDDLAFWRARFCAGKVTGCEIDKGGQLWFHGDAPGVEVDREGRLTSTAEMPGGKRVRTAIEEVSLGAFDWTDGNGRVWPDAPVHLALTPLPVWVPEGGQPPFEPADLPQGQRFSTRQLLYRFASEGPSMAEEKEEKGPPKEKKGKDDSETVENESTGGYTVGDAIEELAAHDIILPDDTSDENFLERLCVVLNALKGQKDEPADMGVEDEAVTEEPGATFMSTRTSDPVVQVLLARVEADDRTRRLGRITALTKRGLMPVLAKKLREAASTVRFAVNSTGHPVVPAVDAQLDLLEQQLPPEGIYAQLVDPGAGAEEAETPEAAQHPTKRHQKVADEQYANSRRTPVPGHRRREGA